MTYYRTKTDLPKSIENRIQKVDWSNLNKSIQGGRLYSQLSILVKNLKIGSKTFYKGKEILF